MTSTLIEPWVLWTLLAAAMQAVRTAGQKQLAEHISVHTATMVRYLFGLPFALVYLSVLAHQGAGPEGPLAALPTPGRTFWLCALAASVLQIIATIVLVHLFTLRHFAVGTTYVRTEIVLTAIIGAVFFSEVISSIGWVAIVGCAMGLVLVNLARSSSVSGIWNQSAAFGLAAGLGFSLTSLLIRKASLSLSLDSAMLSAAYTLAFMVIVQTLITVVWVTARYRHEWFALVNHWRPALFVGLTSVVGSAGWFTAFTLERAAYVKTLGQVEFVLTLLIGIFYFREIPNRLEGAGMVFIVFGVIVLLLAA